MSIKQVGVTIGGFVSGITMPTIAHHVGWRLALLAPAGACAAVALSALREPPHARARTPARRARPPRSGSSTASCPRRFALGVGGFGFVMGGLQLAFVTYLSLYLKEAHGYRLAAAGISLAVTMAAGTVGRSALGGHLRPLLRRAPRRRACASTRCSAWPAWPGSRCCRRER